MQLRNPLNSGTDVFVVLEPVYRNRLLGGMNDPVSRYTGVLRDLEFFVYIRFIVPFRKNCYDEAAFLGTYLGLSPLFSFFGDRDFIRNRQADVIGCVKLLAQV